MKQEVELSKKTITTGNYLIPHHQLNKLSIFKKIGEKEIMGCGVGGEIRIKAKAAPSEVNMVYHPECPKGLSKKVRTKIEKEANRIVRLRYRPRPEYYKVPTWIRGNKLFKKYYIDCLAMEIKLRDGYICREVK